MALPPPQDFQRMWVTSPVGSPPLSTRVGLTVPNPRPCAKSPPTRPSTGAAAVPPEFAVPPGSAAPPAAELPHPAQAARSAAADISGYAHRGARIMAALPGGARLRE